MNIGSAVLGMTLVSLVSLRALADGQTYKCLEGQKWEILENGDPKSAEEFCCFSKNNSTFFGIFHLGQRCCKGAEGNPIYDDRTQLCDEKRIINKTDPYAVCGKQTFNKETQRCCRNRAVITKGESCAERRRRIKCHGVISYNVPRKSKCCGVESYDSKTQICCVSRVYGKRPNHHCENEDYISKPDLKYYVFEFNARNRTSSLCSKAQGTLTYGDESKSIQLILPSSRGCLKMKRTTWYLVFSIVEWKDITDSLNVERENYAPVRVKRKLAKSIKKFQSKHQN